MKKLLINARDPNLIRVAILAADGTLEDIDIESAGHTAYKGNIYKAQVVRVEPSLGAAFVEFGAPRNGFLPLDEVGAPMLAQIQPPGKKKGKALSGGRLERGQEVIVQATREPMGTKGAALTTYVALPGRYLVYLPGGDRGGISRKIESAEERSKLAGMLDAIRGKKSVGLILRTAGQDRTKTELKKDFTFLDKLWKDVLKAYRAKQGPGLVWREQGAVIRAVRDYYSDEIGEIWVDKRETYEEVLKFFELTLPKGSSSRVRPYKDDQPLFERYGIEEQIARARQRRVELPSGGSIVIDPTEALVAVDVNSGKLRGERNIEETALRTNSEAAREIARQLRLRNLGGIVVIDFIDMRDRKKRTEVERVLKEALRFDKANVTLGKIGQFGTLEMLRQRLRTSGAGAGLVPCPACEGTGKISGFAPLVPLEEKPLEHPKETPPLTMNHPVRSEHAVAKPTPPKTHTHPDPPKREESSASDSSRAQAGPSSAGGKRRRRRRGRGRGFHGDAGSGSPSARPPDLRVESMHSSPERAPQALRSDVVSEGSRDEALRQWSRQIGSSGQFTADSPARSARPQGQGGRPQRRGSRGGRGRGRPGGGRPGGGAGTPPDNIGNRR